MCSSDLTIANPSFFYFRSLSIEIELFLYLKIPIVGERSIQFNHLSEVRGGIFWEIVVRRKRSGFCARVSFGSSRLAGVGGK